MPLKRIKRVIKRAIRTPGSPFKRRVVGSKLRKQKVDYTQAEVPPSRYTKSRAYRTYRKAKTGVKKASARIQGTRAYSTAKSGVKRAGFHIQSNPVHYGAGAGVVGIGLTTGVLMRPRKKRRRR